MELRINKDKVSHIRVYDEIRGIWGDPFIKLPATKKFWWFFIFFGWEKYKEAYYKNGSYSSNGILINSLTENQLEEYDLFSKDNEIYQKPKVEIFSGNHKIKLIIFDTYKEARSYCSEMFSNVNVIIK